jgi:CubicO group peptidase (beta-lactamase class C family)
MDRIFGFSGSVLVARGDDVLLSKGYGLADASRGTANEPTTRFRIGSVTKQFTGAAILLLQQQKRLTVRDSVCRYLATCPPAWKPITLHHALTHTSGLPNVTDLPQWEDGRDEPVTPTQQLEWVRDLPLDFAPGSEFRYSNTGYLALGLVIEKVTGTTYEDYIQTSILKPLGMADSGYDTGDDRVAVGYTTGTTLAFPINMTVPHAAGALYSTAPDLLRWQHALLAGKLLDPNGTKMMTTPAVDITDLYGFGYSYGIFVGLDPAHRVLVHEGGIDGFLSRLSHDTSTGITVVVLTNHEDTTRLQHIAEVLTESALG